uniref:Nucleoporin NSP1-like C-terminal domain-containing protein n=1 Tax=Ditylenchus dipsaci TaxID=166011 RepID=A0A915D2P0_9BILA
MFGNNSTPLFGSQPAAGQPSTTTTPSIFGSGNQPATSTPSILFGSQPATGQPPAGAPSIFGTLNTATTAGTQPLFGVQGSKQGQTLGLLLQSRLPQLQIPLLQLHPYLVVIFFRGSAGRRNKRCCSKLGLFGTASQGTTTATSTPSLSVLGNNPTPLLGSQLNSAGQASATTNSIFGISSAAAAGATQPVFGTTTTIQTSTQAAQPKSFAAPASQTAASNTAPLFGAAPATNATSTTSHFGAKPSSGQTSTPLAFVTQPAAGTPVSTATSAFVANTDSSGGQTTAPLSFGAQPATATPVPASSAAPISSAESTMGIFGTAPQAPTVTAATQAASVFGASNDSAKMSYKDLEQTLKVLRMDFENQEKQFLDEVDDLNTYDNILRRAQDKISGLAVDVDQLERQKDRFKYELQVVEQQQTELDNLVTEMEKVLGLPDYTQGTPIGLREPATTADVQRQNILQLQVTVDAQLKQIDDDVTDICEQLLDLQKIGGIRQILRKQIDTLGWVDKQSDMLGKQVQKTAAEILTLQK